MIETLQIFWWLFPVVGVGTVAGFIIGLYLIDWLKRRKVILSQYDEQKRSNR